LLVGTSSARTNTQPIGSAGVTFNLQHEATSASAGLLLVRNSDDAGGPYLTLSKTRGTSVASNTVVASGDTTGVISFLGADGTNLIPTTTILSQVDGIPGTGDMPGRLVFSTTADGASSPTERLRITNDGVKAYDQTAPAAVNATATLTVANLKTGIITSTSAAATDMTLPTGTDTEAGFSGVYTNMTFEWSVINTGPSLVRVLAGTAHTIVGSGSVATGTSGRFASRRTAANTFVTYRLS
jgi:CheY-specific phosphatase CheX